MSPASPSVTAMSSDPVAELFAAALDVHAKAYAPYSDLIWMETGRWGN